jgi:L-ascorbate metabolism protein UlaG (beta-lactamase superfamily)
MEITWLGHACFRVRGREATILIDPYGREHGNLGKPSADIVLVSHDHPGHSYVDGVVGARKTLTEPGEYEIKSVPIVGVQTAHDGEGGRRRGRNIAWAFHVEEISVCHLGDIGAPLSSAQVDELGGVDVLLVPVGGHNTVNAAQASEIVTQLEPKIVIPMHYGVPGRSEMPLEPVEAFLRQQGTSGAEPQPRLTITRPGLPDETQVVVLEERRG